LAGAIVSLIPIAGVILSGSLLNRILVSDIVEMVPSAMAGLVATISTNMIHHSNAVKALEDDKFYFLWKLKREKPSN
jgi:hypothetical protein